MIQQTNPVRNVRMLATCNANSVCNSRTTPRISVREGRREKVEFPWLLLLFPTLQQQQQLLL